MRTFQVTVNGKTYDVGVEETTDGLSVAPPKPAQAAPQPALAPKQAEPLSGAPVKAPMPGVIVKVAVAAGDTVTAGQTLAVLEAMKMENEITAASGGTVAQVLINTGAAVETGDVIMVIINQ